MNKEENDRQEILDMIKSWIKSVQDGDLDGATSGHANDIVMFDVPMPHRLIGIDAYSKSWQLFFANNERGSASFNLEELEIVTGKEVSFCFGLINVFNTKVRITIGLRRIGSVWMICHEHHSYPIEA